ncbi:hypothetical protein B0H19DRAFT_1082788 [Mycena capillaripes]|nr:hypothetical protein B0H19DRAFT_1082788 [Mycena capillaripes]
MKFFVALLASFLAVVAANRRSYAAMAVSSNKLLAATHGRALGMAYTQLLQTPPAPRSVYATFPARDCNVGDRNSGEDARNSLVPFHDSSMDESRRNNFGDNGVIEFEYG